MILPRLGQPFRPYVYTHAEIDRLVKATDDIATNECVLAPPTFRTLIWLLYGAGLRVSEALNLTLADVDLAENLLVIHQTKFYKARIVPMGPSLTRIVLQYEMSYGTRFGADPARPLLISKRGKRLMHQCVDNAFVRLRSRAGSSRSDGARYQPRLHDMRHYSESRIIPHTDLRGLQSPENTRPGGGANTE
ncbi:tyrosine-type recombinase/integrase [Paraburkholderia sp. RAU6.4a]|uniref:tyrosine-type recombinase/integrase n=1 Tax=Paraburkholderia sp. RAU6.4a TaxID=2991067 RepID=UPI003D1B661B